MTQTGAHCFLHLLCPFRLRMCACGEWVTDHPNAIWGHRMLQCCCDRLRPEGTSVVSFFSSRWQWKIKAQVHMGALCVPSGVASLLRTTAIAMVECVTAHPCPPRPPACVCTRVCVCACVRTCVRTRARLCVLVGGSSRGEWLGGPGCRSRDFPMTPSGAVRAPQTTNPPPPPTKPPPGSKEST